MGKKRQQQVFAAFDEEPSAAPAAEEVDVTEVSSPAPVEQETAKSAGSNASKENATAASQALAEETLAEQSVYIVDAHACLLYTSDAADE